MRGGNCIAVNVAAAYWCVGLWGGWMVCRGGDEGGGVCV